MEIKDIIRKRREELNLTYEQLGNMIGVGKSTVRKWETGMIENMRRDNIVALSKALNISPSVIMGWDVLEENVPSEENKISKVEIVLLENYNKLNDLGKEKLIEYSNDLIETPKYIDKNIAKDNVTELITSTKNKFSEKPYLMPKASHDKKGSFTTEEYKHDDDIMNDDDFWNK